jgi:spectinomycin phosphotransferase
MLEKHYISDQSIINYLNIYYGLEVHTLTFLPLGADANALVYKADTQDKSYFIKLKKGFHDDISVAIMNLLQNSGLQQIILPLKTIHGQLIQHIDGLTLIVYPFIVGASGFNQALSEEQWLTLGAALRKIHETDVPALLKQRLRQESYSPKWRDAVRSLYNYIKTTPITFGIALQLQNFMKENAEIIHRLINNAEQLAGELKNDASKFVLCHSDIHAGNVLIASDNTIYIVDWDDPIMAPKERDLMFIGGGVANVWNETHQGALFYKAYGPTEINRTILAYYRHERIIEDIAEFGESIFLSDLSNETKLEHYHHFKAMFEPRGVVDIAFATIQQS